MRKSIFPIENGMHNIDILFIGLYKKTSDTLQNMNENA